MKLYQRLPTIRDFDEPNHSTLVVLLTLRFKHCRCLMSSRSKDVSNSLSKICQSHKLRNSGKHIVKKEWRDMLGSVSNTDSREPCCNDTTSLLDIWCSIKKHHVHHALVVPTPAPHCLNFLNQRNGVLGNEWCILQTSCGKKIEK